MPATVAPLAGRGESMKKILALMLGATAAVTATGAAAGELEDVNARLEQLERQNAAIRKENAALRENQRLLGENNRLKSRGTHAAVEAVQTSARPQQENGTFLAVSAASRQARDPLQSYATDFPVKAPPLAGPAQFRAWIEGGAIWSGGDPVFSNYSNNGVSGVFDLTPKVGWETAIGFDHHFAGSPWHISGQFRYGEGGATNGTRTTGINVGPVTGTETSEAASKETHWLADLAAGRDIAGSGPGALQLKGGIRIAEFVARNSDSDVQNATFGAASSTVAVWHDRRASFIGAGPLIGLEGSIPFAGKWSFDYNGDIALLVGRQQSQLTRRTLNSFSGPPAFVSDELGTGSDRLFAGVLSADIQVGVSYWLTQNLKLGAGYRLDAFVNVFNQDGSANSGFTPDRYTHGPRVTLTGQFDAM
ncbi:Lpg1974 family pore-forming outer membrane protein [Bradyrhizobium sp. CB2312]|uniref:Lpg1974 family pore-forming outer membrane protein n=1 Tax=Bradyrhizobium sp. CB2312 TaxID=3039155 RepID=UPI0024B17EB3|nr:Lpg1974 family pore-forming outer membrane protein [Bradyrhizobium sp. CB2312]WFU71017.1 Lpg1974 family pore-forming outer membrane protein [Bradyrhizobium sp. CB2312]